MGKTTMTAPKFKKGDHIKKIAVEREQPDHGGKIVGVNDHYDANYYLLRWDYFLNIETAYDFNQIDSLYKLDENPREFKLKVLVIEDEGFIWNIPLEYIAANRAQYYAKIDKDTTYQDEFEYLMEDDYEAKDWYLNNMNFSDIADHARLVQIPKTKKEPDPDFMKIRIEELP